MFVAKIVNAPCGFFSNKNVSPPPRQCNVIGGRKLKVKLRLHGVNFKDRRTHQKGYYGYASCRLALSLAKEPAEIDPMQKDTADNSSGAIPTFGPKVVIPQPPAILWSKVEIMLVNIKEPMFVKYTDLISPFTFHQHPHCANSKNLEILGSFRNFGPAHPAGIISDVSMLSVPLIAA